MQVCTITQAVRLRKIHGRVAKRAPWMRIAAVHGGGIQTKDAVDCEHYIIETYCEILLVIDELAARLSSWGARCYNCVDRLENLIDADGIHTDIAVARALVMVAGVDACEHARPS